MIKAVLFDLDHTLYDRDATLSGMAPAFFAHFRDCFNSANINMDELADCLVKADRLNYSGWPAVYHELESVLPWTPPGYGPYEAFMNAHLGINARPYPETNSVLEWCRDHSLIVGMVTNGITSLQNDKIDTLGIRRCFDFFVISGDLGKEKPDPAIFRHAAKLSGASPQEIVFVGDNPINDILAASAAGMVPIWLDHFAKWPEGEAMPKYVAHRLGDVVGILETLSPS